MRTNDPADPHEAVAAELLHRRTLLRAGAAIAVLGAAPLVGAQPVPARRSGDRSWRWLINEAVTGETNVFVLTSRYRPMADFVSQQLKTRPPIEIEPVVDIKRFVAQAQAKPRPELIFGKSVNQLARLVRDHGYVPLVRRADPYKAAFIVAQDSRITRLADVTALKAKIIMPDEYSATTAVARAELRRQNVQAEEIHTKFQEAVAQQLKSGLGQVGVVNPTTARKWAEDGGRILAETQPVVNWSVLASPALNPEDVAALREALLAMNTQAPQLLATLGVKEWAAAGPQEYLDLLAYTRE